MIKLYCQQKKHKSYDELSVALHPYNSMINISKGELSVAKKVESLFTVHSPCPQLVLCRV